MSKRSQPAGRPPPNEAPVGEEPPGLPGFRSWKGVYLLVFGWFVVVVAALAVFSRIYA